MYEDLLKRDSLMDSVETHINSVQRPTMIVDLDYILIYEYRTAKESGQKISRKDLQQRGKQIYSRQCHLKLYVPSGERIEPLIYGVNEDYIRKLLNDPPTVTFCPSCEGDVKANDSIVDHIIAHAEVGSKGKKYTSKHQKGE